MRARGARAPAAARAPDRRLREIFAALANELHWLRAAHPPGRLRRIYRDHVLIAEAILRRQYDEAERRLVAHLETLRAAQVAQARQRSPLRLQGERP